MLSLNQTINWSYLIILPTKTTAAQTEDALSYHRVRGQYFLAVIFVRSINLTVTEVIWNFLTVAQIYESLLYGCIAKLLR